MVPEWVYIKSREDNQKDIHEIYEKYRDKPWENLIISIIRMMATSSQFKPVIEEFFKKYPTPKEVIVLKREDLYDLFKRVGRQKRKSISVIGMSKRFHEQSYTDIDDLPGIGAVAIKKFNTYVSLKKDK